MNEQKLRNLLREVDCRIEHGASSNGHLEYVRSKLQEAFIAKDPTTPRIEGKEPNIYETKGNGIPELLEVIRNHETRIAKLEEER